MKYGLKDNFISTIEAIELDDLDSPYTFDLCIYNKLKNVALKEEIDKVGQIMLNRINS